MSTEQFTTYTSEHEMTIHQRKKAATALDLSTYTLPILPMSIENDSIADTAAPINIKEGMENKENADADTKDIMDRNLTSINAQDSQSKFKLRDYYIKAAYNAFNPDKFKNSNVSMDALLYVIARGCRFIDFEVFSVENEPVIASSSVNSFNYKETYNHIPVADAFEVLGNYVFSGSKCPNPGDPFIIHMRIMSRNITMYDKLAKIISQSKSVARYLLGPKYGREYQSKDLGNEDLLDFKGKIILIVDGTNPLYRKTKLFELINMSSNSLFLSKYNYFGVKNVADPQVFKDANKKNMCLVLPAKAGRPINDGHNGPTDYDSCSKTAQSKGVNGSQTCRSGWWCQDYHIICFVRCASPLRVMLHSLRKLPLYISLSIFPRFGIRCKLSNGIIDRLYHLFSYAT